MLKYHFSLEEMEKKVISESIKRHNGNLSIVATRLCITRQTLYNEINKYGL